MVELLRQVMVRVCIVTSESDHNQPLHRPADRSFRENVGKTFHVGVIVSPVKHMVT